MREERPLRLRYALAALGVYVVLLTTAIYFFAKAPQKKPKHYVEKNDSISVSLLPPPASSKPSTPKPPHTKPASSPKPKQTNNKPKPKPAPKPKKTPKPKPTPKPKKQASKPPQKPSPSKKTKTDHTSPSKPKPISNLFSNIKTPSKPKPSPATSSQVSQKPQAKGIENAYLAKVEKILYGWPAQSEYAGKKATVWLKIAPSGRFEFKLSKPSSDMAFNKALIAYLEQLQGIGFGPHRGKKPYRLEVEFIAKE